MAFNTNTEEETLSEINMTPLVDVMLVLLIIFIVTLPVMHNSVQLELPKATANPVQSDPKIIIISVNAQHELYLNNEPIQKKMLNTSLKDLFEKAQESKQKTSIQILADKKAEYEHILHVLITAKNIGFTNIGFVTQVNN